MKRRNKPLHYISVVFSVGLEMCLLLNADFGLLRSSLSHIYLSSCTANALVQSLKKDVSAF